MGLPPPRQSSTSVGLSLHSSMRTRTFIPPIPAIIWEIGPETYSWTSSVHPKYRRGTSSLSRESSRLTRQMPWLLWITALSRLGSVPSHWAS
jgi:hypothetical protein